MADIVLITGGTRSGKSAFAQAEAERLPGSHCYVATCVVQDREMEQRVCNHQLQRSASTWATIEEPLDLAGVFRMKPAYDVYLVDCLTLWISNIMYDRMKSSTACSEGHITELCERLVGVLRSVPATILLVSGEVGMGIVPENKVARLYRDLVGVCNQTIAAAADDVYLVSCGIPLPLKQNTRKQ